MPIVSSSYKPSLFFRNGHLATIYNGLFRKVSGIDQVRERINLSDGDLLDLDWSHAQNATQNLVILLHGLEGDAQRPYITGSAKLFNANGFDACSVNYRGCSGEPNSKYRSYHSGATEDLKEVLDHIITTKNYGNIYLKGFSLGGNLALKYLGEGNLIPKEVKAAVAISVPCSLQSSCEKLLTFENILYAKRFKRHLIAKLRQKQKMFPQLISNTDIKAIKTLKDFDDIYTSRAHGFKDALDYYTQCSCLQFLPSIQVPSLIINATDDSFLGSKCYPYAAAEENHNIHLEIPRYGGHVGFWGQNGTTYTEARAVEFFNAH
ncbi:YheT family hydrolase [Flagellimonas algicola]|uniref:Alpha/beta fold hydrolase n=1 Tax=Flagellimonas algicola TaxID=2583815 RepID=A0ABY2WKZ1_9FLAO|nr:alpha/beta fold hydrolase [Allomuricauda algicola]TMU55292.1 alpha/beta fold hydrolase [Allomuricauda algicola]